MCAHLTVIYLATVRHILIDSASDMYIQQILHPTKKFGSFAQKQMIDFYHL